MEQTDENASSLLTAGTGNGETQQLPYVATSPASLETSNKLPINKSSTMSNGKRTNSNGKCDVIPDQPEDDGADAVSRSSLPTPPDGGWGWAVVFASFMIHVIGGFLFCSFLLKVQTVRGMVHCVKAP